MNTSYLYNMYVQKWVFMYTLLQLTIFFYLLFVITMQPYLITYLMVWYYMICLGVFWKNFLRPLFHFEHFVQYTWFLYILTSIWQIFFPTNSYWKKLFVTFNCMQTHNNWIDSMSWRVLCLYLPIFYWRISKGFIRDVLEVIVIKVSVK
jgi:hypothetical protein